MTASPNELKVGDALIIVDVQNDFCPGGALPIERGDEVVPVLNDWIAAAQADDLHIYASRDYHPKGHMSFDESGGPGRCTASRTATAPASTPTLICPRTPWS